MKVLIAPDSFKESLSAPQVASIIASALRSHGFECRELPIADGGEGTTDSLVHALNGTMHTVSVRNPMWEVSGGMVQASYGMVGTTAIMEMAQSSGLMLVAPENRNPLIANTYGFGEMILHALDQGATRIVMGIGGSATNDGGVGMLMALGVRFLDACHMDITRIPERLGDIVRLDTSELDKRLHHTLIEVACDVSNPLLGTHGATAIYGPQKGVTPTIHTVLESGLAHMARLVMHHMGEDFSHIAGAGAAGGLGFGLVAFLGADLKSGIDLVLKTVDFDTHVQWADIVITGEGKVDSQTIHGKTPAGVAKHAHAHKTPTVIVAGCVQDGWESLMDMGVKNAYAITPKGIVLTEALKNAPENLKNTMERIVCDIQSYVH